MKVKSKRSKICETKVKKKNQKLTRRVNEPCGCDGFRKRNSNLAQS